MAAPGTPNVVIGNGAVLDIFGSPDSHMSDAVNTPSKAVGQSGASSRATSPGGSSCAGAVSSSAGSASCGSSASPDNIKKLLENYKIICEACERCSISFYQLAATSARAVTAHCITKKREVNIQ